MTYNVFSGTLNPTQSINQTQKHLLDYVSKVFMQCTRDSVAPLSTF